MKFTQIILSVGLCSLMACSCTRTESSDDLSLVSINFSSLKEKNLFLKKDGNPNCQLLKLETTDECLIKWIEKIVIDGDYIFVKDMNYKLFVFNAKNGKFLNQIGTIGSGPEELLSMYDFYVDDIKKHVCIYDGVRGLVLQYSYTGELLNSDECNHQVMGEMSWLTYTPNRNLIATMTNYQDSRYKYRVIDTDGYRCKGEYLPFCVVGAVRNTFSKPQVATNRSHCYALGFLSDTIYQYSTKGDFIPKFVFNNGLKHRNDESLKTDYQMGSDAIATLNRKGMSTGISELFLIGDVLHFLHFSDGKEYKIWWNVKNNQGYYASVDYVSDPIKGMYSSCYYAITENALVSVVAADDLVLFRDEQKEAGMAVSPELEDIKEEDNPVLAFYFIN